MNKVVVTGLSAVHALGMDADSFWDSIIKGKSGIAKLNIDLCKNNPPRYKFPTVGSDVGNQIDYSEYFSGKEIRQISEVTRLTLIGIRKLVEDANLKLDSIDKERAGTIIATGIGPLKELSKMEERARSNIAPHIVNQILISSISGAIALETGFQGDNFCIISACSSSSHSIGEAFHKVKYGINDIMITGGIENILNVGEGLYGFAAMKALASDQEDPTTCSRPFDATRDGFVIGDGVGLITLESEEHAKKRGAKIYAEIIGYGASCDAYHRTSPEPEGKGLINAISKALKDANLKPEDIDYINAHGTSTQQNDKTETFAIKKLFGQHANKLLVSSTKSMTGHLLGAAGGIEAIATAKTLQTGIVPPTINYKNPDPNCDLNYVPNEAQSANIDVALSQNLGFGGVNAVLAFQKYKG